MAYLYETHLHTSQASACGASKGSDYVKRYQDLGFSGLMVTDHFFRGNCSINRNLPWKKWVEQFCKGYEDAKEEGLKLGFDVFFGWEETFDGDDYLVYGLDKDWLIKHPEVRIWTRKEQYDIVREAGGCVIQAHPFRQRQYIHRIYLSTGCVDAVEAANGGNEQSNDALAWIYANKIKLPVIAGTDIHNADDVVDGKVMGVYLNKKITNIGEFVSAVLNRELGPIKIPAGRCDVSGNEDVFLPVDIRDKKDRSTGKDLWDFLGI